jgi:hypothetical protein
MFSARMGAAEEGLKDKVHQALFRGSLRIGGWIMTFAGACILALPRKFGYRWHDRGSAGLALNVLEILVLGWTNYWACTSLYDVCSEK